VTRSEYRASTLGLRSIDLRNGRRQLGKVSEHVDKERDLILACNEHTSAQTDQWNVREALRRCVQERPTGGRYDTHQPRSVPLGEHCRKSACSVVCALAFTLQHHDRTTVGEVIGSRYSRYSGADDDEIGFVDQSILLSALQTRVPPSYAQASSSSSKGKCESNSYPSVVIRTCCSSLTPSLPPTLPM
jgi:hypothetical protein